MLPRHPFSLHAPLFVLTPDKKAGDGHLQMHGGPWSTTTTAAVWRGAPATAQPCACHSLPHPPSKVNGTKLRVATRPAPLQNASQVTSSHEADQAAELLSPGKSAYGKALVVGKYTLPLFPSFLPPDEVAKARDGRWGGSPKGYLLYSPPPPRASSCRQTGENRGAFSTAPILPPRVANTAAGTSSEARLNLNNRRARCACDECALRE